MDNFALAGILALPLILAAFWLRDKGYTKTANTCAVITAVLLFVSFANTP